MEDDVSARFCDDYFDSWEGFGFYFCEYLNRRFHQGEYFLVRCFRALLLNSESGGGICFRDININGFVLNKVNWNFL